METITEELAGSNGLRITVKKMGMGAALKLSFLVTYKILGLKDKNIT